MKCYLCGSENLTQLTDRIRSGPGIVKHCAQCNLAMLDTETEDLQSYYDGEYRKEYGPELGQCTGYDSIFEAHVEYQQHRIDLLKPYLGKDKRLLEVGCSTGHFLFHAKDQVGEVFGADFDSGATEYAATKCGIKTFGGNLIDSNLERESFDIICAYQTLEHVPDPIGFMEMLKGYLKPDGIVVIEVPNLNDPLMAVYENEAYRPFYYHEAHIYYFTEQSLGSVMERAGLSGAMHYIQDYNLGNHLHWSMTNGPQPTCHEGLGAPTLPVGKGCAPMAAQELQDFWVEADRQYKEILAKHKLTDNMTFIGSKAR